MLYNCTVAGNSAAERLKASVITASSISIRQLAEQTGQAATFITAAAFPGLGHHHQRPSFVDADGGDLRLKCGSPCIDTGPATTFSPPTTFEACSGLLM